MLRDSLKLVIRQIPYLGPKLVNTLFCHGVRQPGFLIVCSAFMLPTSWRDLRYRFKNLGVVATCKSCRSIRDAYIKWDSPYTICDDCAKGE